MATLILAICGRRLAQSAKRAGADVIVADFFGDVDTRSLAPWYRLPGSLESGIDGEELLAWARSLPERPSGIVYGAGFEARPELLGELSRIAPLIGNPPEVVATIKDPFEFARLLQRLNLPHPEIASTPRPGIPWLRKRRGGSGGTHIEKATALTTPAGSAHYFQVAAAGSPISALFVANGRASNVVGFSAQWTAPTPARPYRYGGCAGPVRLPPELVTEIEQACAAITEASGLVGLNSMDMLVADETFTVLEVNPRPGATLDVFDGPTGPSLWASHLAGVRGELPAPNAAHSPGARAATILYADKERYVPTGFQWGSGIADIPTPASRILEGMPICTVISAGPDADAARALAERRAATILDRLPVLLQQSA
ncbi:MAG TPA: ATP-grasp domain-containing protein [Stellaceae bacterium]|nr:ATP-grasp domain-containing protein [Stellaceae bacterium]